MVSKGNEVQRGTLPHTPRLKTWYLSSTGFFCFWKNMNSPAILVVPSTPYVLWGSLRLKLVFLDFFRAFWSFMRQIEANWVALDLTQKALIWSKTHGFSNIFYLNLGGHVKSLSTFAICCIYVIPNASPNMDSLTKGTRCFLTRFKHINPTTVLELSCTKVHAKSESKKASKKLFKAQKGLKSYNKAHWILQHKSSERIWWKTDLTYTLWCLPWDALSW